MPGIGATLKAGHDLIMGGQHIDHLAFSFVAPLQTENDIDFFSSLFRYLFYAKDIFCIQRYELFSEIPNPAAGLFNKLSRIRSCRRFADGHPQSPLPAKQGPKKAGPPPFRVLGGSACGIGPPPAGRTSVRNAVCGGNKKPDRPLGKSGSAPAAPAVRFPRRRPSPPPPGSSPPGCRRRP